MKKSFTTFFLIFILFSVLLSGCVFVPTPTSPTFTPPIISSTFTPEPTVTRTPKPPSPTPTKIPEVPNTIFDIEQGAPEADIESIKLGIAISHRYIKQIFGEDVGSNSPLTVKIIASGKGNQEPGGEGACCTALSLGEARPFFDVLHPEWLNKNQLFPGNKNNYHVWIASHEYVHTWQNRLGCLGYNKSLGRWLEEGMPNYISSKALIEFGFNSEDKLKNFWINSAISNVSVNSLKDFEAVETFGNASNHGYSLGYLATEWLAQQYGVDSLLNLCEATASKDLRIAFQEIYNLSLDADFYPTVEEYFKTLGIALDAKVCGLSNTSVTCLGRVRSPDGFWNYLFNVNQGIDTSSPQLWTINRNCPYLAGWGVQGDIGNLNQIVLNVRDSFTPRERSVTIDIKGQILELNFKLP